MTAQYALLLLAAMWFGFGIGTTWGTWNAGRKGGRR